MTPDQPAHPLHALTTYELQNYQRDLEHALTAVPENAADRELLNEQLAGGTGGAGQPRRHRRRTRLMTSNGAAPGNASPIPANVAANRPAPTPEDAARISGFLREHPSWTAFWDKRDALWRVTEDDPDSALYAASNDIGTVIAFMATHA